MRFIILTLCAAVFVTAAAEFAGQFYSKYVQKRARLFRSDRQVGWTNVPNLSTMQINAAGQRWYIRTDQNGHRIIPRNASADRRILILGDSLCFGEGVNIEDRFDAQLLPLLPDTQFVNTGVSGHGTDQEYLIFKNWRHILRPGDTVLIVLNRSDYLEVLRQRFFGRGKPYFEKSAGSFVLHAPRIGFFEGWSDTSRVASLFARLIEPTAVDENPDPRPSIEIIRFILGHFRDEVPRGVSVVLAHEGGRAFLEKQLGLPATIFCEFADVCVDLDGALTADPRNLLPDGHWSPSGNAAVARVLLPALRGH